MTTPHPVPGRRKSRGAIDTRAALRGLTSWASSHREWLALATVGVGGLLYALSRPKRRSGRQSGPPSTPIKPTTSKP